MDFPGALIPQLVGYLDGHTALAIEAVDKSHAFHVGKCRAELLKGSLIRTPGQRVPALHYNHMWCLLRLTDRGILPNWPVWLYSAVKFVSRPSLFKFLLIFDELCMSHSARDLLVPRLAHDQRSLRNGLCAYRTHVSLESPCCRRVPVCPFLEARNFPGVYA